MYAYCIGKTCVRKICGFVIFNPIMNVFPQCCLKLEMCKENHVHILVVYENKGIQRLIAKSLLTTCRKLELS